MHEEVREGGGVYCRFRYHDNDYMVAAGLDPGFRYRGY